MPATLPASVTEVLTRHQIDCPLQPVAKDDLSIVQTALLHDSQGKLQVFYPAGSLLNIDALRSLTGRQLKPLSQLETELLCQSRLLKTAPGIPTVLGLELAIDEKLLQQPQLLLNVGDQQTVALLSNEQFKSLSAKALTGDLSVYESDLQTACLDMARDVDDITQAVANFTQLRIKSRLEETLEFPPLPSTAQRIIKLRVDPNADIDDLTDIVESDPSLAAQVVSWAASPYYAAPGKIKSVHDAIFRVLGFDLVLNLSLGLALGRSLCLPRDAAKGFSPYWQQAVYGAAAVEALVKVMPPKQRPTMGMAYLSGLLHNFGYLILAEVFPPHFSNICRYQEANPYANHAVIERHLLGVTREQLGSWLMRLWHMPEEVCTAIRFQNEADYNGDNAVYSQLLFIAMRLLRNHGIGDAPLTSVSDDLYQGLQLDSGQAKEAIADLMESSAELNAIASNMAGG